nr:helix-turn-helix domain-containing protein [Streptomyces taklimakanensis]
MARELRRLRRDHGLTLAALARRTNYSKSSWERYLNGKTTPPRQAVVAFAHVVGVRPDPLLTLLESAGTATEKEHREPGADVPDPVPEPLPPSEEAAASAPASPTAVEPRPVPPAARRRPWPWRGGASDGDAAGDTRHGTAWPHRGRVSTTVVAVVLAFFAGMLADRLSLRKETVEDPAGTGVTTLRSASESTAGTVGCSGFECKGQDPQRLGCHIGVWTAAKIEEGDIRLELRYSPSCRAAWSRITGGSVGDVARVEEARGTVEERAIRYDHDTYSPMVEAHFPAAVRACAELVDGRELCTPQGGASPLPEEPTNEAHKD